MLNLFIYVHTYTHALTQYNTHVHTDTQTHSQPVCTPTVRVIFSLLQQSGRGLTDFQSYSDHSWKC